MFLIHLLFLFVWDRSDPIGRPFLALIYQLAQRDADWAGACIIDSRNLLEVVGKASSQVNCRA